MIALTRNSIQALVLRETRIVLGLDDQIDGNGAIGTPYLGQSTPKIIMTSVVQGGDSPRTPASAAATTSSTFGIKKKGADDRVAQTETTGRPGFDAGKLMVPSVHRAFPGRVPLICKGQSRGKDHKSSWTHRTSERRSQR